MKSYTFKESHQYTRGPIYRFILRNIDGVGHNYIDPQWFKTPKDAMKRAREAWNNAKLEGDSPDFMLLGFNEIITNSWWAANDSEGISKAIVFVEGKVELENTPPEA